MCTAVTYKTKHHYFGRNLDLEYSYHETVTITPRNYPFLFRKLPTMQHHFAMIGMAYVVEETPLYYEATNEKGLSCAGLNFPDNADYKPEVPGKDNVCPFELIPWILGQCENIAQVKEKLDTINLVNIPFSTQLPLSPLHWIFADKEASLVVECVKEGLKVYDNPTGVLTNNPTFDYHMMNLNNYMGLSRYTPANRFSEEVPLHSYCVGMGALGLPGDYSSASRFVKAAYVARNSCSGETEEESVGQFFHILHSVAMPRGVVEVKKNVYDITIYSCCCNTDTGVYYYTTYENSQITGVDMYGVDLEGDTVTGYPLITTQQIRMQNERKECQ